MIVKLRNIVRIIAITLRHYYLVVFYGMNIHKSARVSWGVKIDKTHPKGIFIGEESYIASGTLLLAHDYSRNVKTETKIGKRCFIGANSIIMPGITIGDNVIVGAGAVVTKNVLPGSIVAGNPARVIKTGIETEKFGRLIGESD